MGTKVNVRWFKDESNRLSTEQQNGLKIRSRAESQLTFTQVRVFRSEPHSFRSAYLVHIY